MSSSCSFTSAIARCVWFSCWSSCWFWMSFSSSSSRSLTLANSVLFCYWNHWFKSDERSFRSKVLFKRTHFAAWIKSSFSLLSRSNLSIVWFFSFIAVFDIVVPIRIRYWMWSSQQSDCCTSSWCWLDCLSSFRILSISSWSRRWLLATRCLSNKHSGELCCFTFVSLPTTLFRTLVLRVSALPPLL